MVERKYLAHFLDAKFDMTYKASEYVRYLRVNLIKTLAKLLH